MNALAKLLNQLLGWDYNIALWICSAVVLVYVLKGGLTSAIYTEVLQFFMIVLGFAPVVYLGLKGCRRLARDESFASSRCRESFRNLPQRRWHDLRLRCLDERMASSSCRSREQSNGRGLVRDDLRPRLRVELRLLVHELPRRPARDGRGRT